MHYYKRNIGDYYKKAGKLSMLEHGAYTLLLDACYDREKFPTRDEAIDWCWARTADEVAAVEFVLRRFFILEEGAYIQTHIVEEIEIYANNSSINRRIAKEREAKRKESKARTVNGSSQTVHEAPPNHKPLTINQEPNTAAAIAKTWQPSVATLQDLKFIHGYSEEWAQEQVPSFVAYWLDRAEERTSWNSIFIQHCEQRAKLKAVKC